MATLRRLSRSEEEYKATKRRPEAGRTRPLSKEAARPAGYQRDTGGLGFLSTAHVTSLQRAVGNRAVTRLLGEQLGEQRRPAPAASTAAGQQALQRSLSEEEELVCPGSGIRSGGQGKGLGFGLGQGPVGIPTEETWGTGYGGSEGPIAGREEEEWG